MYKVTKRMTFCYGHRLMDYQGKCRVPHGHNGGVEFELLSDRLDHRARHARRAEGRHEAPQPAQLRAFPDHAGADVERCDTPISIQAPPQERRALDPAARQNPGVPLLHCSPSYVAYDVSVSHSRTRVSGNPWLLVNS